MSLSKETIEFRKKVRTALADYIRSEGCSCCENTDKHNIAKAVLGKLLRVPMYSDKSGYDFYRFCSNRKTCVKDENES